METGSTSSVQEEVDHINENSDENLEANIVQADEEPRIGMTFSSEEEVTKYYKSYARCMGFGTIKINSKNAKDGKKVLYSRMYLCKKLCE